ncbi:hypothetical protein QR680_009805 [Steinernema hermaphroditum]|uniref:G-protein coupled receptors family 1 profile domain-containing protein n=1 Tax=Steinernema hermaphroditum TaxID=289476 RepID=A0AA39IP75_9BILA|nr:hypothetical protein QR680_009805 [Steinernema hermaphroditum]
MPALSQMSNTPFAMFLQFVEIALFCCGFITQFYFLVRMRRVSLLHFNLKVLLGSFSVAYVIVAVARLMNYVEDWIDPYSDSDSLTVPQARRCFIRRLFYDTAINVISIAMATFAFERLFATIYSHNYEKHRRRMAGMLLGLLVWLISFAGSLAMFTENLISYDFWNRRIPFNSCDILQTFPKALQAIAVIALLCYTLTALAFVTVHAHNRRVSKEICLAESTHSLSLRYQHAENISTTRFLSVIVGTFGVDLFCSCFTLFYVTLNKGSSSDSVVVDVLSVAYNIVDAAYSFLFPVMCILLHRPLRDQLKEDLRTIVCWKKWNGDGSSRPQIRSVSGKHLPFTTMSLSLVTPRVVSRVTLLRAVCLRSASSFARPTANFQVKVDANEKGHFQYERDVSRDSRYANPQKQGDTPMRFMFRRLGHAYEVYPIFVLTGWWLFLFTVAVVFSFEKLEVWFDRTQDKAPWDWSRIRENYWKKSTLLFDLDGRTHQRLEIMEKLQDQMMEAANKRNAN